MFGGQDNRPSKADEKFAGLPPGSHCVTIDDMVSGVSDKTGNQYWIIKLLTEGGVQFDHFIQCQATEFKSEEKVYNALARQMEALYLYDTIGSHVTLDDYVQKALDVSYQLKGKKVEFTIKPWKMDGKEGVWGEITGFLDIPNEAIQKLPGASASAQGFDANEELGF